MGLVFGIIVAVLTVPVAWAVAMSGSNWETGQGGSPTAGFVVLGVGWTWAALLIISHYHPVHLSW